MRLLSDVSLPWRVVKADNEIVYIVDADDEMIIRAHNVLLAKHIANCVNAFAGYAPDILDAMVSNGFTVDELSKRAGAMERRLEERLPAKRQNLGKPVTANLSDSEGGHCD